MVYKNGSKINEMCCIGKDIRNVYLKVGESVKNVFSADMLEIGVMRNYKDYSTHSISYLGVARKSFKRIAIFCQGMYPYIRIPKRYADDMKILVNDVVCTLERIEMGNFVMLTMPFRQTGIITLEGRHNG